MKMRGYKTAKRLTRILRINAKGSEAVKIREIFGFISSP